MLSETGGAINLNGPVTQANLDSITRSGGTVTLAGTFDNGNSATALNVGTGSKLGALVLTGSIANATVNDAGAGITFQGFQSTLNHVTYQGTMDLSAAGSTVTVLNGLTLKGLNGSGAAKVLLTGSGSTMNFEGTQTLDNALLDIGGGASILAIANAGRRRRATDAWQQAERCPHRRQRHDRRRLQWLWQHDHQSGQHLGEGRRRCFDDRWQRRWLDLQQPGHRSTSALAMRCRSRRPPSTNSGSVNVTTGGVLNLGQPFGASTWSSTGAITETGATINIFGTTTTGNWRRSPRPAAASSFSRVRCRALATR